MQYDGITAPLIQPHSLKSAILDITAGVIAIALVVGTGIISGPGGFDFRLTFTVTGLAFLCAGLTRGQTGPQTLWGKALLVATPGVLLGTAALVVNMGLHRLSLVMALDVLGFVVVLAGIMVRRCWRGARKTAVAWLVVPVSCVPLAIAFVPLLSAYSGMERQNYAAPPFVLQRFDGDILSSGELRGQIVVLAFWASWCLPCRGELPEIESLQRRFEADGDVAILAVDTGWEGETIDAGRQFLRKHRLNLTAAFDPGNVASALHVDALPTIVIIDRHGRVRSTHNGYDPSERLYSTLSAEISALLNE